MLSYIQYEIQYMLDAYIPIKWLKQKLYRKQTYRKQEQIYYLFTAILFTCLKNTSGCKHTNVKNKSNSIIFNI